MEQTLSFRKYAWNLQSCSSFIFFTVILTRRWITQPLIALNGYTCFHLFGVSFTTVPSTWRLRSILGAGDRSKILYYCCHWCTGIAVWAGHSAKVEACKDCSSMFQLPWDNPRRTEGKKRREIAGKRKRPKRERRLTFCCDFIPQFRNWMHALLMIGLHILWTSRCFSFTDWLILAMIDFSSTCVSLQLNSYCNSVVMSTAAPLQKSKRAKAKKKKEALKIIRRKLEDVAEVHTHT